MMAQEHKEKRLGRPPKAATPGKRVSLGLKVTPEIKQRLDEEARKNGRTQSQQAELMIERSFAEEEAFGGAATRQMVYLMASSFIVAGQRAAPGKSDWMADAHAYTDGMIGVLDALFMGFPYGEDKALQFEALASHVLSRIAQEKLREKERLT